MRKALTLALAVAMAIGAPAVVLAQSPISTGSVSGRAVDAAGRGVVGERVELMRGPLAIGAVTTDARGDWSFLDVAPGDYTVQLNVRGKVAGVRVSVGVGQAVTALVVVPTAAVSPQLGLLGTLVTTVGTTGLAAAVQTAVAANVDVETVVVNETILTAILTNLTPAQRVEFVTQLIAAVVTTPSLAGYAQYVPQLTQIRNNPSAPIPVIPAPRPAVSG